MIKLKQRKVEPLLLTISTSASKTNRYKTQPNSQRQFIQSSRSGLSTLTPRIGQRLPKINKDISGTVKGIPLPNDDFSQRQLIYCETFGLQAKRNPIIIDLQISFTEKFCYITLAEVKKQRNFKLRLTKSTGKYVMEKFTSMKLKFKDYIFRDNCQRYLLSVPYKPFYRSFYFTNFLGEVTLKQKNQIQEDDWWIKDAIKQIDRTQQIYKIKGFGCDQHDN